jgi:8-oxo-dGTP pyrophosphatase MutT (NUDIX family)/5'(3')-deoxyribonucleotidase
MSYKIFLDMDGVIADFDKGVADTFGESADTVISSLGNMNFWKQVNDLDHFWLHLEPMPDSKQLWDYVKKYEVTLLTTPVNFVKTCKQDKKDWAKKYLGDIDVIFSASKEKYSEPQAILIDDREDNIKKFQEAGGIGILHTSAKNTIEQLEKEMKKTKKASADLKNDKTLYTTEWIILKETDGGYIYTITKPGVAILPIRQIGDHLEVLVRQQVSGLFGETTTIVTGRSDEGEDPLQTAIRELQEETGIIVSDPTSFVQVGDLYYGKNNPIPDTLFFVFIENAKTSYEKPETDGTIFEEFSQNYWISEYELESLLLVSEDPTLYSVLCKFLLLASNR